MQVRTVSAILVWVAAALLILNNYLRSEWALLIAIGLIVIAVLIYFLHVIRLRREKT